MKTKIFTTALFLALFFAQAIGQNPVETGKSSENVSVPVTNSR